jgi:hypothetical protein
MGFARISRVRGEGRLQATVPDPERVRALMLRRCTGDTKTEIDLDELNKVGAVGSPTALSLVAGVDARSERSCISVEEVYRLPTGASIRSEAR